MHVCMYVCMHVCMYVCIVTRVNKHKIALTVTGWRRPIGCLELQVIFRKRATDYRALLRKMTSKDKASYASSPPCMSHLHASHLIYAPPCMSHLHASHLAIFLAEEPLYFRQKRLTCSAKKPHMFGKRTLYVW